MDKIYSRPRFVIKNKNFKTSNLKIKLIKLIVTILLAIIFINFTASYVEPIFDSLCQEKVKSIATIITNEQSTIMMNKYKYEELYSIDKDESGKMMVIKSNVAPINNLISDLTESIQLEFDKVENPKIRITLGSLTGIYFLSGIGPEIPIEVAITGTVDTQLESEFIAQGINQTLHRVFVSFVCDMKIVTPIKKYSETITNQVLIAEQVIVGNIPDVYFEKQ